MSINLAKLCLRDIDVAKTRGDWNRAEQAARACLAVDALDGHATIALAEVLAITGSAKQAAAVLDSFANELGPEARKFAVPLQSLRRKIAEGPASGLPRSGFSFVGREEEMIMLSRALAEAKQVSPRGVLLFGEAGIGKSRIASEFALRADLEGCAVVRFNAHPHDKDRPMGAFTDLVPNLLDQPGAIGCAPESMQWLRILTGRKSDEAANQSTLSSIDTANAVSRAVVDVISAISAETPLVLVFDDAQWIDRISLQLMRDIVRGSHSVRVLVILTTRAEDATATIGNWAERLLLRRVEPLDRSATLRLVSKELSTSDADESLLEWMVDIARGNPFFADSLVAQYRSTGERFSVPPQLSSIVDQRVLALTSEGRDVLEAIVALGRRATIDRLEIILRDYGTALIRHARELGMARLIEGDKLLISAHWLIVESVQRNATPLSQRLLHRRIASMLESELRPEGDSSELWECAQAWIVAGDSNRAASLIGGCADHALNIGRAREASDLYSRASGMADASVAEAFAEASVRAAVASGDPNAILRGMPLLRSRTTVRIHDDIELAEFRATIWSDLQVEERLSALRDCFETPTASREHRLTAARAFLSACADGSSIHLATDAVGSITALLEHEAGEQDIVWAQTATVFHSVVGDPSRVSQVSAPIIALADVSRPDAAAGLLRVAAVSLQRAGNIEQAILLWTRAHDVAEQAGLSRLAFEFKLTLASLGLDHGDIESARRWFSRIEIPFDPESDPAWQPTYWAYLSVGAEFALYDGDWNQLTSTCERATHLPRHTLGPRANRYRTALSCLHAHLRHQAPNPAKLISTLTAEQLRENETGLISDFEMTVLLAILQDLGEHELASSEFEKYVDTRRRTLTPLSATLVRVRDRLNAAAPT